MIYPVRPILDAQRNFCCWLYHLVVLNVERMLVLWLRYGVWAGCCLSTIAKAAGPRVPSTATSMLIRTIGTRLLLSFYAQAHKRLFLDDAVSCSRNQSPVRRLDYNIFLILSYFSLLFLYVFFFGCKLLVLCDCLKLGIHLMIHF